MVLPATHLSALLLLAAGLICLGSWPNLLKLTTARWRFELFYIDFALGSLLLAILAACTFGTFGSEASFGDRILVAGRLSQVWVISAGLVFNLGNMLLVAAISLVGISAAFPLAAGLALLIDSVVLGGTESIWLRVGIVLLLAAAVANVAAGELRDPSSAPPPTSKRSRGARRGRIKRSTRGLIAAAAAGVVMSPAFPLARKGMEGDLALGPYAGMLMFSIGMVISMGVFNFYFRNIPIDGPPIHIREYFAGRLPDHLIGLTAGAVFALGWLVEFLAVSGPFAATPSTSTLEILALSATVLACLWGLLAWKEFSAAPPNSQLFIWLATGFLFAGVVVLGLGR